MGTPLPPLPPDPGELCSTCWGDDGELGRGTPRVLSIQLFDLEHGEFWNDLFEAELLTPTDLIQNAFLPCFFANVTPFFTWFINYVPDGTLVEVRRTDFPSRDAFRLITVDTCVIAGPNFVDEPGGVVAFNGTMSIYLGST